MKRKNNEGFTLVELMVTIVVASIVTLAASTVLLLGIRLNKSSSDTAQQQNTVRIFLSVVERMATEGTIKEAENDPDSWVLYGENEDHTKKQLFYYSSANGTIYSGGNDGAPLMEDIIASHIAMFGELLTVAVETEDGSYTTSVYCRSGAILADGAEPEIADRPEQNLPDEVEGKAARAEFLKLLVSQLGSTGMILEKSPDGDTSTMIKTPLYYAQWYSMNADSEGKNMWPIDTPWCACFLSWGLNSVSAHINNPPNPTPKGIYLWYADVDEFKNFFTSQGNKWGNSIVKAAPGDLIFFDWTGSKADAAHVGVVLAVKDADNDGDKDYVYTIEGNSANMVAVRKYSVNDSRIMGYGILDWKDA